MDVTKPYEFIGFGVMDVTKPCEFIGFGVMDVTKPYKFIGFGAMGQTNTKNFPAEPRRALARPGPEGSEASLNMFL